jgi:hypothetical protein
MRSSTDIPRLTATMTIQKLGDPFRKNMTATAFQLNSNMG